MIYLFYNLVWHEVNISRQLLFAILISLMIVAVIENFETKLVTGSPKENNEIYFYPTCCISAHFLPCFE